LGVIIFGLFSLKNLAIDQYPEMDPPYITVATVYAGANAADIETNITRVLEDQLNSVDNLKEITSTSKDNVSMITLEMEWGSDLDVAMNDVRDIVSRTQTLLPDEVDYPTIFKFSSSMMPVMLLSVTADESYYAMDKILDDRLVNVLNRVNGIGSVSVIGQPVREIQVNVDPEKIEAFGLTIESIGGIIASENLNVPAGSMDLASGTYNVKADGEFTDSEQLKHLVVSTRGGRTVKLSDVAEVKDTIQKITMDTRANGRRSAMIMIQKQSGANTVEIVEDIQKRLPAIQASLPKDIKIVEIMNGATEIQKSINSLAETVMLAFVFVIIVVMVFLGRWRATFIICMTIPISLVTAFIYLFATDSTLNLISLSSLSIAIGMVVDDAIVVLENITTHIERGSNPKEAAIYGTNEVWLSVIATTLVVVAVFMPLTMVSGMAGILFKELGWIVSIVVCMSTTAAVTLTPMLSAYIHSSEGGKHDYKGVGIIYKPIDMFLDWLDDAYARMLAWTVRHRWTTVALSLVMFIVSIGLLKFVPFDFFPPSDNAQIT
ncbi:MAG: efflux RND transporter permease subunit, partial [Rikenellaceae bacterium]|nr:efflux RND transporter permease subunit [Rikenellaceae bacterium]